MLTEQSGRPCLHAACCCEWRNADTNAPLRAPVQHGKRGRSSCAPASRAHGEPPRLRRGRTWCAASAARAPRSSFSARFRIFDSSFSPTCAAARIMLPAHSSRTEYGMPGSSQLLLARLRTRAHMTPPACSPCAAHGIWRPPAAAVPHAAGSPQGRTTSLCCRARAAACWTGVPTLLAGPRLQRTTDGRPRERWCFKGGQSL